MLRRLALAPKGELAAALVYLHQAITALAVRIVGPPPPVPLPARVGQVIRASEDASEILVGWMQVGAIAMFAALYALSEKSFPPGFVIEPVPAALMVYALFTALRLYLAYQRRLNRVLLGSSVIVDFAVLMLTIWSFHLQYHAPPGLYLKAPTLLYVFVLIALRALRFEARDVLLAGASAIVGWSILVAFAALDTPGGMEVTRSYVEYMTSYKLLIGAELDKLVSISAVTGILCIVVIRGRRMLTRMAAGETAANDLARFVGRDVAQKIRNSDMAFRAGQGRIRNAAILFVDLRGFTNASRMLPPHEVIRLLGDYQSRIVPIIEDAGGNIDKFLGDGILASFGAVRLSATFAADAWSAAEAVLQAGKSWAASLQGEGKPTLAVAVALSAGHVISGAVGYADRLEFTVIGDAVNLAAKLEKHTKVAGVRGIATRKVYELARNQSDDVPDGLADFMAAHVEGVDQPVDLVAIA